MAEGFDIVQQLRQLPPERMESMRAAMAEVAPLLLYNEGGGGLTQLVQQELAMRLLHMY